MDNTLLALDKQNVWHPFTPQEGVLTENILITRAEGIYLHTADDRKIIDAISSWWVNLHGHSHPVIANAIATQVHSLEHIMFASFTHEPAIQLAKNILSVLPSDFSKVFYSDNGSTANEVAIKMAIQYWHNRGIKKKKIAAFEGAYHGDTFGAMAVGDRSVFTNPFSDYLFEVDFIPLPTSQNFDAVISAFKDLLDTKEVGAFIFEPLIQGAAGMRMYPATILDELLLLAKQHDVICIADEVFTGFYRTGKFFAVDHLQHTPDIIALSKGLTGGFLPMGATVCTPAVYKAFLSSDITKAFLHGHSYTGNPLACAAANASFSLLQQQSCIEQIQRISANHTSFAKDVKNHPRVAQARTLGTILAIELTSELVTDYSNPIRNTILTYFLNKNILLRPLGNIIYVVPPYVITEAELKIVYTAIQEFIDSL